MKYTEILVWTSSEAVDSVVEWLSGRGIDGVAIEDREDLGRSYPDRYGEIYSLLEEDFPPEGARIRAYVYELPPELSEEAIAAAVRGLAEYGIDPGPAQVAFKTVDEEDWSDAWKKFYHPTSISGRLTVVPTWEQYQPRPNETVLRLDPGMAFGTGTHATTVLALGLLEEYLQAGDRVVDVGCGSGILAIAAAKLGAKQVLALDLDPVAVKVTRENCQVNGVGQEVEVRQNDLLHNIQIEPPRIIMSNILADILLRIVSDAYQLLQPDGMLLLSGIISQRAGDLLEALRQTGFQIEKEVRQEDWIALAARKPAGV